MRSESEPRCVQRARGLLCTGEKAHSSAQFSRPKSMSFSETARAFFAPATEFAARPRLSRFPFAFPEFAGQIVVVANFRRSSTLDKVEGVLRVAVLTLRRLVVEGIFSF